MSMSDKNCENSGQKIENRLWGFGLAKIRRKTYDKAENTRVKDR